MARRIYLAGPITGRTDADCYGWRERAQALLSEFGFEVLSPMCRDFRGREEGHEAEIVEGDKADIDKSDILFAHCDRPSYGTTMEIHYAWERGKIVVIVIPPGSPKSPWLTYHSKARFSSIEDAVAFLKAA